MKKLITILMLLAGINAHSQTIMNVYQNTGSVLQIPLNSIDSITYSISNPGNLATLTTLSIGNISSATANSGGNIINNGGSPVTQRGVVWGTTPNPTTANSQTNDGSGIGNYTSNLTNLTANTTYYVRAYATNSAGTAYGNQLNFTTTGGGSGIISNPGAGVTFNGYTYASIILGNGQEWMAENLRTNTYANGDPIPHVVMVNQWAGLTTGAWVYYDNHSQYENPYGKLYNWYAAVDPRNVCPTGWHVPTDAEWIGLTTYLGGNSVAGDKMKSTGNIQAGTGLWQAPNTNASNESGFTALPGGHRDMNGSFDYFGSLGVWWTSTQENTFAAWTRAMYSNSGEVERYNYTKTSGYSLRCLKD